MGTRGTAVAYYKGTRAKLGILRTRLRDYKRTGNVLKTIVGVVRRSESQRIAGHEFVPETTTRPDPSVVALWPDMSDVGTPSNT
jgi:hypothetical protein